jgi:hypothetical protein
MNEELKAILGESITIKGEEIPIAHLRYKGKSKKFITWTLLGEAPSLSANDEPLFSVCPADIDIFSDGNYLDIVKEIKKKMKNAEWVWVGDSPEMFEEDTGLYHLTCSFEKERITEWQE